MSATTRHRGVLVTGATTPFGRALVAALLARPETEAVLAVAVEDDWGGPRDPRLRYVHCDLTRSRGLHDLLFGPVRDLGITAVVHSAHHRSVRVGGPRVHALNVETTREMLQLAERHPTIRRFVYLGSAEIYRIDSAVPELIGEDHPIEMSPEMPQRLRDRVEADLTVCTRMGLSPLSVAVLRVAEIFAADSGSQLYDYLLPSVCYRPLGFDPMLDVISIGDAVRAAVRAVDASAQGVFNIPGADVLPLSAAIAAEGRVGILVPGPVIRPLYAARALVRRSEFSWTLNRWRFRWSGVLDGARAQALLAYSPTVPVWRGDTHYPSKPSESPVFSPTMTTPPQ